MSDQITQQEVATMNYIKSTIRSGGDVFIIGVPSNRFDEAVLDAFEEKGVMILKNLTQMKGFNVSGSDLIIVTDPKHKHALNSSIAQVHTAQAMSLPNLARRAMEDVILHNGADVEAEEEGLRTTVATLPKSRLKSTLVWRTLILPGSFRFVLLLLLTRQAKKVWVHLRLMHS